jgi:hypothetical protein
VQEQRDADDKNRGGRINQAREAAEKESKESTEHAPTEKHKKKSEPKSDD